MIEYNVKIYKNGNKEWFLNNKLHREDGPAVEWASGSKFWYLNGKQLSAREFLRRISLPPEFQVIEDLRKVAEKYGYKLTKE